MEIVGKKIKRGVTKRHQACLDSGSLALGVSLSTLPRIIPKCRLAIRNLSIPCRAEAFSHRSALTLGSLRQRLPLDPDGIDDYFSRSLIMKHFSLRNDAFLTRYKWEHASFPSDMTCDCHYFYRLA